MIGSIEMSFRRSLVKAPFCRLDASDEWVIPPIPKGLWLVQLPSDGGHVSKRQEIITSSQRVYKDFLKLYRYLADPAVFVKAVEQFANRYGFLGEPKTLLRKDGALVRPAPLAEPFSRWSKEVTAFHDLADLAQLLGNRDIDALHERIVVDSGRQEFRYRHPTSSMQHLPDELKDLKVSRLQTRIADARQHPERYEYLTNRQAYDRAWAYLSQHLNRALQDGIRVAISTDAKHPIVGFPTTLLSALYLQLYQKAARLEWHRTCAWCEKALPSKTTVRRKYCNVNCRVAASERRHAIAKAQAQV